MGPTPLSTSKSFGEKEYCGSRRGFRGLYHDLLSPLIVFGGVQSSNKHDQQPHIWDESVNSCYQKILRHPSNQMILYGVCKH